jgi:hypothetical protein
MEMTSQQRSCSENQKQLRLSGKQRLLIGAIFPAMAIGFVVLHIAAVHRLISYPWPCGFKAQFGLPCPTCGMTTSLVAFAKGNILNAFYIQPAAATLCCLLIGAGAFSLVIAIAGTDWGLVRSIKLKYIIVTFMVIIGGGWAVTLARALANKI